MRRLIFIGLGIIALATGGCAGMAGRSIVEAQTPGTASGAGATVTGPANSATPTTQTATRTMSFAVPAVPTPTPRIPTLEIPAPSAGQPPPPPAAPQPVWVQETVQTSIGAHQDAAGIVKVAVSMSKWSSVKWIGLLLIVGGIGGILWSYKNEESGYPLVYIKTAGIGIFLVIAADNPAWLLLALLPLGLYAAQKFNLLRFPVP